MIRLGLCSGACITRDAAGVVAVAAAAGLDAIEWASDVHLSVNEPEQAEKLMIDTLEAGLTTASYSTIYRAGSGDDEGYLRFDALLRIAAILQAPIMRIYACYERVTDSDSGWLSNQASELKRLGDKTARKGITLCLSMGRGTGGDRYDHAQSLVETAAHPFVRLAWEDLPRARPEAATAALRSAGKLAGMAVARCAGRDGAAHSIAEDENSWRKRVEILIQGESDPKMGTFLLLGSVRAGGEEGAAALAKDVRTLRAIVAELEPPKKR